MKLMAVLLASVMAFGLGFAQAQAAALDDLPPPVMIHEGESPPSEAWRKAMETADLPALARMHDKTTVAFPPDHMEQKGRAAIMKGYEALFAKYAVQVAVEDAHWVQRGPLVVSWGLTTLTLHPKGGGNDTVSHTRFTDAAVKTGSGWIYLVDQASKPTPN